jgi:hypothetical protein
MSFFEATTPSERRWAYSLLFVAFLIVFFAIIDQAVTEQREETLRKCLEVMHDAVPCQLLR